MYYDNFDCGFGMTPGFDCGFGQPMFNGGGCFPAPSMDMGFNGGFAPSFDSGFGMGMPITCGYSPAPFGCNPVSMDLSGNVCIDGIPITPNGAPSWMVANAARAEMHLNELEMQLNDPNLWMQFLPKDMPSMGMEWSWDQPSMDMLPFDGGLEPGSMDGGYPMDMDPISGMPIDMSGMSAGEMPGMTPTMDEPLTHNGEEVLPCGLTQSQYDQHLADYQKNLADCERLLNQLEPGQSALRAMIMNNISRIKDSIENLDKPYGVI